MKVLFSILFLMVITPVLAKEPGQVAIEFLEKVRDGKVDLEEGKDTALSPHITKRKRELIEKTLQNLSSQIGKGELVVGKIRQDGDYAAVMVMQGEESERINLQVFPVALVRGDDEWRAAPILASFENAVAAYTVPLRKRLSEMETWMMQQRVLDIESMVVRSAERLKQQIKSSFQIKDLTDSNPLKIWERFQSAYAEGRQIEVLGYLGGYSDKWPSDWDSRVEAMRLAFSPKVRGNYPWRLLSSPDVVRVVVNEEIDKDEAIISLACLDPVWAGETGDKNGVHFVHFSFSKDKQGQWTLELPESFLLNDKDGFLDSQGMDDDLLDRFTKRLRKLAPLKAGENVEQVEQALLSNLENGSMMDVLQWLDFGGDSSTSVELCVSAGRDWWSFRNSGDFRIPIKLGQRIEGDWAVAVYHLVSWNQVDRFESKPIFFQKTSNGWVWVSSRVQDLPAKTSEVFSAWIKNEEGQWREKAKSNVLGLLSPLEKVALDKKIEDAELHELVENWSSAIKQKNLRELSAMSAQLGASASASQKAFRNLAYELALSQRAETEFTGIHRAGNWTGVGFRHVEGKEKVFSFMLVVASDKGLKVLTEIDLIASGDRTRKFLNQRALDRLKPFVSGEELEQVKGLFEKFEGEIGKL